MICGHKVGLFLRKSISVCQMLRRPMDQSGITPIFLEFGFDPVHRFEKVLVL
jgi:hypothetical protein